MTLKRRDFITLLCGAASAWPLAARAQQGVPPMIGFLNSQTLGAYAERIAAFQRGLKEGGFVDGANLTVEYRFAEGHEDRLPALAADLVRRGVKAIAGVDSTAGVLAAKAATASIPIVFAIGGDPVKNRLVDSLNHPGGNVTGVTSMGNELGPKRLGLLHDLLPNVTTIAALINPSNPNSGADAQILENAALSLGLTLKVLPARDEREIDTFFATLVREHIPAFLTTPDSLFVARRQQIVTLAAYHAIPAIYEARNYVDAGGLISYAAPPLEGYRQAGIYVSRILKGEKPGELPILQSTRFQLVINLKTAKALGLTVPPTLLAIADDVIE
jgi:putative tryptophan/tyrosine transport system substrate-binding protein